MRERFLEGGDLEVLIARGLAGLNSKRAWEMREKLLAGGVNKGCVAVGINGDWLMGVAWRVRAGILPKK